MLRIIFVFSCIISINALAMTSMPEKCTICEVPSKIACPRCKVTYYCKEQHQNQHWPIHKKNCEKLVNFYPKIKEALAEELAKDRKPGETIIDKSKAGSRMVSSMLREEPAGRKVLQNNYFDGLQRLSPRKKFELTQHLFTLRLSEYTPCKAYAYSWLNRAGFMENLDKVSENSSEDFLFDLFIKNDMDPKKFIEAVSTRTNLTNELKALDNFENDEIEILRSLLSIPGDKQAACLTTMVAMMAEVSPVELKLINPLYQYYLQLKASALNPEDLVNWLKSQTGYN